MIDSPPNTLAGNSFLHSVSLFHAEANAVDSAPIEPIQRQALEESAATGLPTVVSASDTHESASEVTSALAFPIYQESSIKSFLLFAVGNSPEAVGVFEVWTPVGRHQELALSTGFFGKLERFQNVSSFVRFEKGTGLPGQAWSRKHSIIHDNLANHPGFLRAAGASAEALQTAIGIPIFAPNFLATVILISSESTPLAQGVEVWTRKDERKFELHAAAYSPAASKGLKLNTGATSNGDGGLLGPCLATGNVSMVSEQESIFAGRPAPENCSGAVTIPTYLDGEISSITSLLL